MTGNMKGNKRILKKDFPGTSFEQKSSAFSLTQDSIIPSVKRSSSTNRVHFENDVTDRNEVNPKIHYSRRQNSFNRKQRYSKLTKLLLLKRHADLGFGFSIRGGVEHGTGIFVSNLNKYSDACAQGLQVGDQILRVNNQSFEGILHEEAVQYIQRQRILRLIVLSLGVVPGRKIALTEYQWIDCYGRPCSPLQNTQHNERHTRTTRGASMVATRRLLAAEDERKVNVVVGDNSSLGLLIRGGSEYGLGIFVAGIDHDSVADRSEIMVGEQILDVNGMDFVNITHTDAAEIIRTSKMMTMILKDVGKIPLARIIYDKTEWLKKDIVNQRNIAQRSGSTKSRDSVFEQGIAGSMLNHQSLASPISYQIVEEKAQELLNKDGWATLKYYIREYTHQNLTVSEFGISLLELLDTTEKMSLIGDVRGIVRAQDIELFDELMLRMEVQAMTAEPTSNKHVVMADMSPKLLRESSIRQKNVYTRSSPQRTQERENDMTENSTHDFNYRPLNEDSYQHSTVENMTEETTIASGSPQPFGTTGKNHNRHLLDESIGPIPEEGEENITSRFETVKEEQQEPLYAVVKKTRTQQGEVDTPTSPLTEYNGHSPTLPLKTFQSPPLEKKGKLKLTKNGKIIKKVKRQQINTAGEDEKNKRTHEEHRDINKLGFAFAFLNSEEQSPQLSVKSDEDDIYETVPDINIYGNDKREMEGNLTNSPAQSAAPPSRLFRDLNNRNFQQTTSLGYGLENVKVEEIDEFGSPSYKGLDGYQEKSQSLQQKQQQPFKMMGEDHDIENDQQESPHDEQFDLSKTIDNHYSNFSVNDIIRQNFLPTTRVTQPYENKNVDGHEKFPVNTDNIYANKVKRHESNRNLNISSINTLNIQNQYQYEKERGLTPRYNRTDGNESSNDDIKMHEIISEKERSPRMTVSVENTFPPPPPPLFIPASENIKTKFTRSIQEETITNFSNHNRNSRNTDENFSQHENHNLRYENQSNSTINSTENINGLKESQVEKLLNTDIRSFSISQLKKTKNGEVLFGRRKDTNEKTDFHDSSKQIEISADTKISHVESANLPRPGRGSIDLDALNSYEPIAISPRTNSTSRSARRSPRNPEYGNSEIKIVTSSHQQQQLPTGNSIETKMRRFNSVDDTEDKSQFTPEHVRKEKLKNWLQTDLRPAAKKASSNGDPQKLQKSSVIQEKMNVFLNPPIGSSKKAALERQRIQQEKEEKTRHPRVVDIPNLKENDNPGFSVNVITNENGQDELCIKEITNISLGKIISVGDIIMKVDDHEFKPGAKKTLANRIIQNKFSSSEKQYIQVTLR